MTTSTMHDRLGSIFTKARSRRDVLKALGFGLALPAAAGVLSACGAPATTSAATTDPSTVHASDATHTAETTTTAAGQDWQEMDRMHEAGI